MTLIEFYTNDPNNTFVPQQNDDCFTEKEMQQFTTVGWVMYLSLTQDE